MKRAALELLDAAWLSEPHFDHLWNVLAAFSHPARHFRLEFASPLFSILALQLGWRQHGAKGQAQDKQEVQTALMRQAKKDKAAAAAKAAQVGVVAAVSCVSVPGTAEQ